MRNILIEEGQRHGVDVARAMQIPPEIEQLLFEFENEAQLVQDILDGLDEVDILNLPVDDWYDSIADKVSGFSIPFTSCDP